MTYTLIRSRRRTVAIHIRSGGVEVRAPLKTSRREIDKFVASKERWIRDNLALSREALARREAFRLDYGSSVLLRGAGYTLTARAGNSAGFDGETLYIPPGLAPEQIKSWLVWIYRRLAKVHMGARVAHFSELMRAAPSAIRITGAKTRWGSCSSKRSVNFSWRLVLADDAVIDYVVVHELAHLWEMNHSARFWAIVEGVLPDYRARQARLKALQRRLSTEDWDGC